MALFPPIAGPENLCEPLGELVLSLSKETRMLDGVGRGS